MFWDTDTSQSSSRTILIYGLCFLFCGAILSSFGFHTEARAASISYGYTDSFGATAPDGPAPYASFTFDDGGSAGTVELTVSVAGTVGSATVVSLYYNLNPSLDPTSLSFVRTGVDGPDPNDISVLTGANAFMADGDGGYDILIDMPPPQGSPNLRFQKDETLTFDISGIATLVAADFDVLSAPAPGPGGAGPYISVARFLSTGPQGKGSDWVGAVPEPSTLVLLGLGSLALVVRRRGART